MIESTIARNFDRQVAAMSLAAAGYAQTNTKNEQSAALDESVRDEIAVALQRLSGQLNWSNEQHGTFGEVIPPGAKVLIKPNLVLHENQGPWGLDAVVTHPSIVRAVAEAALGAEPAEVLVGDAPIQGCDFDRLMNLTGLDEWSKALAERDSRFKGIMDFRRTTCTFDNGVRHATENLKPEDRYVLFDLGADSLLEPVTDENESFRITCYDWRMLAKTHTSGRHCYLIARDVLEADVVINLPKLKTHKKAGITSALKNLVGINGNKEYLPHHRLGGSQAGGDCYPGGSLINRALEFTLDRQNTSSSLAATRVWNGLSLQLDRARRLSGDKIGVEGSWSGNDTVWRMTLDLNRILLYGRADGTLADTPQRRVIHIVDGVVAGHGDGPLSPQPLPLGVILGGSNAAAMDLVGARLLGYDPGKVSVVREAFGDFRWPITTFTSNDVILSGDLGAGRAEELLAERSVNAQVIHPVGWCDAAATGNHHQEIAADLRLSAQRA